MKKCRKRFISRKKKQQLNEIRKEWRRNEDNKRWTLELKLNRTLPEPLSSQPSKKHNETSKGLWMQIEDRSDNMIILLKQSLLISIIRKLSLRLNLKNWKTHFLKKRHLHLFDQCLSSLCDLKFKKSSLFNLSPCNKFSHNILF